MKKFKNVLFYLLFTMLIGLNTAAIAAGENIQNRNLKNFNAIKVSAGIELYLSMSDEESVKVEADKDIIDDIKTEVKDGVLHIYVKQKNWFFRGGNKTMKAYVMVKELQRIDASSGSHVKSENILKGQQLDLNTSSGSQLDLDLVYKNVELDASSGAVARLSGKSKTLVTVASSGSNINTHDLESAICKAKVSSGADIVISVSDELYADASSGGHIHYFGSPSVKDTNESSGGGISGK